MRFTTASLYVLDPDTLRSTHNRAIECVERASGKSDWIEYRERDNSRMGPLAEVRRYSGTKRDEDGDPTLLDWNTIWSPRVTFVGDRIAIDGFMRGPAGTRQDGLCPKHQRPYCAEDEDGEPFVRVEWILH